MAIDKEIMMKETIEKIAENYKKLEESLVSQLKLKTPNHHLTTGTYREAVWKELFEQIIPRKFCIDQSVFIIDSYGSISAEVDLAIFDEQYTPYIFNYGKIKFIPIEAVAVVIQCKSNKLERNNLQYWVDSITELRTSMDSVARVMSGLVDNNIDKAYESFCKAEGNGKKPFLKAQTSTRPIKILCCTREGKIKDEINDMFDIILSIDNKRNNFVKKLPQKEDNFDYWYNQLNHFNLEKKYREIVHDGSHLQDRKISELIVNDNDEKEIVIMSLIFQLNQMLMLINNPILFPHKAYVRMFNEILKNKNLQETRGDERGK